jgi:hypothetical protein
MRHSFTKQCVTFGQCVTVGSALLLGLAGTEAFGQSSPESGRPQQKALINLESNFISRWMSGEPVDKTAAANKTVGAEKTAAANSTEAAPAEASTRKALLPPNSILNRNYPPATSPAAATPLPPTTLVVGPAPISPLPGNLPIQQPGAMPLQQPTMLPGARPMAAPIGTTLPPGVAQAQLVAAQSPIVPGQAPVIIVVPAGWQPDGSVSFAPRTIMSPEVPAEHWPTVERNPFGDRSDRGMFTWPKFAKQIAGATLDGTEPAAPQGPPSKALFAASQQPAAAQPQAKALFAPAPVAAPVAAPAPESRALFAPKSVAPQATPADATAANASVAAIGKKSRALFNFGRKEEDAATPAAPVAVANAAPAASYSAPHANVSMPVDPSEAPPEAPNLSDFENMPSAAAPAPKKQQVPKPAEKQTDVAKSPMKWRAKGSPMSAAEVETVKPSASAGKAERAEPPTQVVEQAAPASAAEQTVTVQASAKETQPAQPAAALATPHAQPIATTAPAEALPANQKALFASSLFSRGKNGLGHARAPSRLAAPLPEPPAPKKPAEKAIVPSLLAMIPGLKDAGLPEPSAHSQGCVTPAAAIECAAPPRCEHVAHVTSDSSSASARMTQSYYAPAVERPSEAAEMMERPTIRHIASTGKSNRRQASMQEQVDEQEADVEYVVAEEVEEVSEEPVVIRPRTHAAAANAVESKLDRQPRENQSGYGTPSNGARTAEERSTKTYRRLTGNDVKAGLSRPFQALNQYTKLPSTITRYASDTTNSDLEEFEKDARGNYAHGTGDVRGNEDAVTSQPAIRRTADARQSNAAASENVIRGGRRRIVTPTAAKQADTDASEVTDAELRAEASDEAAEPEVKATRVRNKSGASVLIYSGADLSQER